jgi:surface antigen
MPSFDDDRSRNFNSVPIPGLGNSTRSLGLLSAENQPTAHLATPDSGDLFGPDTDETHLLPIPETQPHLNAQLRAGEVPPRRTPVVIQGKKRPTPAPAVPHISHRRRRLYVTIAGIFSLFVITCVTLLSVSPLGHDLSQTFNWSHMGNSSLLNSQSNDPGSLVAQATATAVYQQQTDGYDPYGNGNPQVGSGSGSLNWPLGQCTYWANLRYHTLTGYWVPWSGNADQWVAGASSAGWHVSTMPHVPSIIVMMPYVQGAGGYGHVAVVESIVPKVTPTTVYTSNMNWWQGYGGWDIVSYVDFTVGSGIYFVWHS